MELCIFMIRCRRISRCQTAARSATYTAFIYCTKPCPPSCFDDAYADQRPSKMLGLYNEGTTIGQCQQEAECLADGTYWPRYIRQRRRLSSPRPGLPARAQRASSGRGARLAPIFAASLPSKWPDAQSRLRGHDHSLRFNVRPHQPALHFSRMIYRADRRAVASTSPAARRAGRRRRRRSS